MYVFFLLTWRRSYWAPPKFTFKSFFCTPDAAAFEVICPSPRSEPEPRPLPVAPLCAQRPITGSVSELGGHGVGGAGPGARFHQTENPLTCPPCMCLEPEQVRCHSCLQVSTPLCVCPAGLQTERMAQQQAVSKCRPQEIASEGPGMEGIFIPFTFSLFFSSVFCIFSVCFFFLIYCCIILFLNQDILSHQTL